MARFSTALARVRGHGAAKSGTHHWLAQRLTAVALIPLSVWFVVSLLAVTEMNYETVIAWIQSPLVAVFLLLFIFAMFYHAQLGLQMIIEDYIKCKAVKIASLIALKFAVFFAAFAAAFATVDIYFTTP